MEWFEPLISVISGMVLLMLNDVRRGLNKLYAHLEDRKLHTHCGEDHH